MSFLSYRPSAYNLRTWPNFYFLLIFVWLLPNIAQAIQEGRPLHTSADKEVWDRKKDLVKLFGHAIVNQPGETMMADSMELDLKARTIDAKGNCIYLTSGTVIYGDQMYFNLDTRTGSIVNGRVSNDRFTLSGDRINKLGDTRFQTHWGEYSTCRDCPQSWAFQAEDVDMQMEGYAYMSNVITKINDVPALWFPYLIVPMKTQRQSGFLFPRFSFSQSNGAVFVFPFFWATSRSTDMTFAAGEYTAKGARFEWEGRYALSPRSGGQANFYYLGDKTFLSEGNRWALNLSQTQELPFGIEEKFKFTEVSDNLYPNFIGDVPGGGEPVLTSDLIFNYASPNFSAYLAARKFRNLLNVNTDPDPTTQNKIRDTQFDPNTVQVFPKLELTTHDRFIPGTPIAAGITMDLVNFVRAGPDYDYADPTYLLTPPPASTVLPPYQPGIDPIRKTTRLAVVPSLYTTLKPFDVFSLTPSLKYNYYFYSFPTGTDPTQNITNLERGYLLFQVDLTAQLERIFKTDNPDIPKVKHLIRPILTYSYIPQESIRGNLTHPFLAQINNATTQGVSGFNFDDYDLVPIDNSPSNINYYTPLGNSLIYGFTTQLIRRRGSTDLETQGSMPTYQRSIEFSVAHAINLKELTKPNPQPLTRFFSNLDISFDSFGFSTNYTYTPYISGPRHTLTAAASFIFQRTVKQRILAFDRSLSLGYSYDKLNCTVYQCGTSNLVGTINFSLSDYILPSYSLSFDANIHDFLNQSLNLQFQSPSRCWKFTFTIFKPIQQGLQYNLDFAFNLTGAGYGGMSDLATFAH